MSDRLSPKDQRDLLLLARASAECAAHARPLSSIQPPPDPSPILLEKGAVFVTLRIGEELRGCIGTLQATDPLWEAVRDEAMAAAIKDPRFPPVRPEEMRKITIEISVLSPMTPVPSYHEFIPGQHGVVIEKSGRRAVFLPQVMVEMGWGREEALTALCRKAGLSAGAWKEPDARFRVFTVEAFEEDSSR